MSAAAALCRIRDAEHFGRELARAHAWLGWGWPEPTPETLKYAPNLRWSGHLNLTRGAALALLNHGVVVSEARRCRSRPSTPAASVESKAQ